MSDSSPWQPLVSVVLATRNRARLLPRAANSVLRQSYAHLELIIVDDGSSDDTAEVVVTLHDPRVHYLHQEESHGVSAARNAGIRAARGELVAFQDDDDEWLEKKLEKQVAALARDGTGLNLCGHLACYADRVVYVGGPRYFANIQPKSGYGNLALIATPGWLVRRELLFAAGLFDERIHTLEDWELALRLSEHCSFSHLDEPLYRKDRHGDERLSKDHKRIAEALQLIMERHTNKWADRPPIQARHHVLLGRMRLAMGDAAAARSSFWCALRCTPLSIRAWLLLSLACLGHVGVQLLQWHSQRRTARSGAS
ncbi:MAG TPA: glycosyltransferase family 2 protein [Nevskiales bacterium]|nr:glycosyltransferase family 2 protein [Nevskiales bacterium]